MKHEVYKLENLSPMQDNEPVDIERCINEARLQHDAYIAECIVRGVSRLVRSFDNGIVKPVRHWRGNPTANVPS
ncbi:MAG: hypothetical protein V2J55_12595 [Candidatus Competibacteraceae bacterium]|nr:hypothetical protein [Candidatus Competibacteraceae bacterium]